MSIFMDSDVCLWDSMSSNVVIPTHVVVGWVQVNDMVSFDMLDVIENWENKHPSTYTQIYWDTYKMNLAIRKRDEIGHWIIFPNI